MLQIEFIPLKTPDGVTCGHARVRDGAVDVYLRAAVRGQALVLTDGGVVGGDARAHIRAGGRIRAVALQEQGVLRCCGFARNESLTTDDLRRRILALSASLSAAEPSRAAAVPLPDAPQQPLADDGAPYDADLAAMQALRRLGAKAARQESPPPENAPAEFAPAQPPEAPADVPDERAPDPQAFSEPPVSEAQAAETVEEPEADEASFAALCERYDAVAADIRRVIPAYPPAAEPQAAESAPEPPAEFTPDDTQPDMQRTVRVPVANPFPHIFPNARFYREEGAETETLIGVWQRGNERMQITAVLGDYSPQPPAHLSGFTRYIRSRSGGYWVKVE